MALLRVALYSLTTRRALRPGTLGAWILVGTFEQVATFRQRGGVLAEIVGPGPEPGSERLYQSYIYTGTSLELVAINPASGEAEVFASPVPGETGAWGLALGPDGN